MSRPPPVEIDLSQLPKDPDARREMLLDIFGKYVFSARESALVERIQLSESKPDRAKMGKIFQSMYDEIDKIDPQHRKAVYEFAERCMDDFGKRTLALFSDLNMDLTDRHGQLVRFFIGIEVLEENAETIKATEILSKNCSLPFFEYWAKWRFEYEKSKRARESARNDVPK